MPSVDTHRSDSLPKGAYNMDTKTQPHRHVQGKKEKELSHPCSDSNGANLMSVELGTRPRTWIPATSKEGASHLQPK